MRDLNEMKDRIREATWFSRLGEFSPSNGFRKVLNLNPWAVFEGLGGFVNSDEAIVEELKLFPSSNDELDPFYGESLRKIASELGKSDQLRKEVNEIYKLTLVSLRNMKKHPLLSVGPHDFSNTAQKSALYAVKVASQEIFLLRQGKWVLISLLFFDGYWPQGMDKNGLIYVL